MRVSINLASRPFVELRPFFLRLRLMMGALVVLGVALGVMAHVLSERAARQGAELDRLRDQTIASQRAKVRTEQRMRDPANAAVLERAHFLNTLFLRKSFSWTAVMMDLENVLPPGVQVTSIEPAVTADGEVVIRLRVAGDRDRAVQLVRNLERSRRFLQPRLGSEAAQTHEGTGANGAPRAPGAPGMQSMPGAAGAPGGPTGPAGVEFEILANYNPLPAGESYATKPRAHAATGPQALDSAAPGSTGSATSGEVGTGQRQRAARNVRNGFPPNGVVLPAYTPPAFPGRRPMPPVAAQQGGGGR